MIHQIECHVHKLKAFLFFSRSVGERFNLSKGSVYNSFVRVIKALNQIAGGIIRWPSVTLKNQIKEQFKSFGGLEGVIGAIDGTFIEIKAPKEHAHVYTCRKCLYKQLQFQIFC